MKNIIFVTGIVVTLTTLGFVLAGKLELTTFGVINTTVLAILYGWYQKLMKNEITEDLLLSNLELEYVKHNHKELLIEADFLNKTLLETHHLLVKSENLREQQLKNNDLIIKDLTTPKVTVDVVEIEKPKRKRNTKK